MMIADPPFAFTRRSCWLVVIAQAAIGAFTALWAGPGRHRPRRGLSPLPHSLSTVGATGIATHCGDGRDSLRLA